MTEFNFYPAIPATNNSPSVDQPNMQTNNQSANDILAVDHITYNLPNGGTHTKISIATPITDPTLNSTITGELYTKLAASSIPQWFAAIYNGSSTVVNQITGITNSTTGATAGVNGFKLSNGLIINYALDVPFSTGSGAEYIFQTTYAYTSFYIVVAMLRGTGFTPTNSPALSVTKTDLTKFKGITSKSSGSNNVDWIAIGI